MRIFIRSILRDVIDIVLALVIIFLILFNPLVRPKEIDNYGYWTISKRENILLRGITSHTFLELKNRQGEIISQMHGLATDAESNVWLEVGNRSGDYLKVWEFDGSKYEQYSGRTIGNTGVTIATGTQETIIQHWMAIRECSLRINQKNIPYPRYGINLFGETYNSNSAVHSLILCAGLEDKKLGLFTIGSEANLLEENQWED